MPGTVQAPARWLAGRSLPDFPAGIHAFSFKLPVWKYLFSADGVRAEITTGSSLNL